MLLLLLLLLLMMMMMLVMQMVIVFFSNAVDKHVDDDFNVQHDHHRHRTLACPSLSHACRCRDGRTPLHLSAFMGYTEVAKLLVHAKSDVAARDRCDECARRARVRCCALNLTRCPAVAAKLPSKWPSTATNPTWLPSCAAPARLNERFALFSRPHHAALRK